jgi:hypothetical protein
MSLPAALRELPPVEPVDRPRRLSQSLLRGFDRCQRSAYLYLKHHGGAPSHDMDRGTAFHVFAERAVKLMIEQEEERIPPELAKELMAEVLRERGDLTVPVEEQDRLRQMAYHFAEGVWIDPARVIAVERKFVLPVGDWQVSGKVDFASMSEDGQTAEVWDWKTSFAMASYDDLATTMPDGRRAAKAFQLLLYVLLLAYGYPEAKGETCDACEGSGRFYSPDVGGERNPDCATCEGRGYFATLDPPLGEHVQVFQGFELYPQYLFDDGIGKRGPLTVTRPELMDHMAWLEGLVEKLAGKLESWDFPAVPGSHCTECPARAECPLPAHLRDHAGEINSAEQASEAAELVELDERDLRARKKELRNWGGFDGPIRYGTDKVFDFTEQESRSIDHEALQAAVERAVQYGDPFEFEDHVKVSRSTRFRSRKLTPDELAEEQEPEERSADERWGTEAPF